MSVVKPWMSSDPAPGTSQMADGVPGLAFSSAIRLACGPKGEGGSVPGGWRLFWALALDGRHNVLQLTPERGPHSRELVLRVMVTLAPSSPPLSATAGLTSPERPPRQNTVSRVSGASRPLAPTRTLPLTRWTVTAPLAE